MNFSTSSFRSYVAVLLGLCLSVLLAGLAATEWLVRKHVEPNDQLPAHVRLFHAVQDRSAGFGDSHMACGFSPPPGMVNLAFPGENITTMAHKAEAYFATRAPGRIVLQADVHMFSRYRAAPTRGYDEMFDRPPDQQYGLAIRALSSYHRSKLFSYWQVWWRKGSFNSRSKLVANGATECTDNWMVVPPESRKAQARERALLHEPAEDFAKSALALEYRRLLQALTVKGAQVCMVEFPVSPEYQKELPAKSTQAAREWFADTARGAGVRLLPHAGIYALRPSLFSDMDHLTPQGAADFSSRIMAECFP